MRMMRLLAAACCVGFVAAAPTAQAQPVSAEDPHVPAPLILRLFLIDGTTLVSYGEPTRLGDRVVFSQPTSGLTPEPLLHLVDIPADRVDWERTTRYAESARAEAYIAAHGERDYAALATEIGESLDEVALTNDPARRLAIIERARRTLADWPAKHYNYRSADIQQMVAILDEAIDKLRTVVGLASFDLSFVAPSPPASERLPLLPPPTPREAIEATLAAARLAESPAQRMSLMASALAGIERDAERLPSDWRTYTRAAIESVMNTERRIDRQYRTLTTRALATAEYRARAADVRGLERLLSEVQRQDTALGAKRPDAIASLTAAVRERLDEARRLALARERFALQLPELRKFAVLIGEQGARLSRLKGTLEDIRTLVLSGPEALAILEQTAAGVLDIVRPLAPPEPLRTSHTLLVSAAQLAVNAARIRREAALSGDLSRAWDASSAAAGALMLSDRARAEMQAALQPPQSPR